MRWSRSYASRASGFARTSCSVSSPARVFASDSRPIPTSPRSTASNIGGSDAWSRSSAVRVRQSRGHRLYGPPAHVPAATVGRSPVARSMASPETIRTPLFASCDSLRLGARSGLDHYDDAGSDRLRKICPRTNHRLQTLWKCSAFCSARRVGCFSGFA